MLVVRGLWFGLRIVKEGVGLDEDDLRGLCGDWHGG